MARRPRHASSANRARQRALEVSERLAQPARVALPHGPQRGLLRKHPLVQLRYVRTVLEYRY